MELEFQPQGLQPTPAPLAPDDQRKSPLSGLPPLTPASPHTPFRSVAAHFMASDLASPYAKLAAMLTDRWRVMFNARRIDASTLARHLEQLNEVEVLKARR